MVAAQPLPGVGANNAPALSSVLGFRVDTGSAMGLGVTLGLLVLLVLLLAAGLGYVLWRHVLQDAPRSRREPSAGGQAP
jgi:type III secretion protein J